MEWWILLAVFWAVFGCGAGCRRAIRGGRTPRLRGGSSAGAGTLAGRTGGRALDPATPKTGRTVGSKTGSETPSVQGASSGGAASLETPFERLRRQFVEGAITVEEYERRLDRLDPKELP